MIKNYSDHHELRGFRLYTIAKILDNIALASWSSLCKPADDKTEKMDTGDDYVEVIDKETTVPESSYKAEKKFDEETPDNEEQKAGAAGETVFNEVERQHDKKEEKTTNKEEPITDEHKPKDEEKPIGGDEEKPIDETKPFIGGQNNAANEQNPEDERPIDEEKPIAEDWKEEEQSTPIA